MESIREGGSFCLECCSVKTFRRIKQKNIGKTVDIPDENGYYITVARPTQG